MLISVNDKVKMVDANKIDDFISDALKSEVKSTIDYVFYNLGMIENINSRHINLKIFKVILLFYVI